MMQAQCAYPTSLTTRPSGCPVVGQIQIERPHLAFAIPRAPACTTAISHRPTG